MPQTAAAWRAWGAVPREFSFSPSAAAPPELPPPGGRYLLPLIITEGFGAWSDSIFETIELAARLNRTWVEPCVRNGCIEPCRCGRIRPVVPWSAAAGAAAAAAGVDPGRLPRIDEPCHFDSHPRARPPGFSADVYPLSALVDVSALLAPGAGISYAAWCAAYIRDTAPERAGAAGLWPSARVYSYDFMRDTRDHSPSAVGDFAFTETLSGMELARDAAPNVFLTELVRGYFSPPNSSPQLPLARWHVDAARAWTRGSRYAAFHWRSEGADAARFADCSVTLVRAAAAALPWLLRPPASPLPAKQARRPDSVAALAPPRALLIADMPAPGNTAKAWNDYPDKPGLLARQHAAVERFLAAGFGKYDAALRVSPAPSDSVDAGVLSIRDYILSTEADLYVTCAGEACRACFRDADESNLAQRILRVRRQAGRPSLVNWPALAPGDVPAGIGLADDDARA